MLHFCCSQLSSHLLDDQVFMKANIQASKYRNEQLPGEQAAVSRLRDVQVVKKKKQKKS